jgi:diguanylate cyclase (GGDEF)-like protein
MTKDSKFRFSIGVDAHLLDDLGSIQRVCLVAVAVISLVTLVAYFVTSLAAKLPPGWDLMKSNSALLAVASALSLTLSQPRRTKGMILASRLLAVFVGVMAVAVLVEYGFNVSLHLDTLLPNNHVGPTPGRMSPQTAGYFTLLATVMFFLRRRKGLLAGCADILACGLCVVALINLSGFLYGALHLYGISATNQVSPQTMVCLVLLTFVAFGRRAEYGAFGILLGTGIGSKIARIAFPIALFLPFALEAGRAGAVRIGLLGVEYATAITTSLAVLLAFGLILILAWRIDDLEREIRELSLRDELTQVYNRRGFYLLAEQALSVAQRSRAPFSVLFVDLDNLKGINDTFGHEVGSAFIREVAELLLNHVRKTDVVGRLGGDEFAIAGQSSEEAMRHVAQRLEQAARRMNDQPPRKHDFSFSIGHVTSDETKMESLEELLRRADGAMYEAKRQKKLMLPVRV